MRFSRIQPKNEKYLVCGEFCISEKGRWMNESTKYLMIKIPAANIKIN